MNPRWSNAIDLLRCSRGCALLSMLLLALAGCQSDLETSYGGRQGQGPSASVNGTDVLSAMFEEAGHQIYFRRSLVTSEMAKANTVVWFPDTFAAPREEVCEWFETWLFENPGRTLIYVGRDFNAAPLYWEHFLKIVPSGQKKFYQEGLLDARIDDRLPTLSDEQHLDCEWFEFKQEPVRWVDSLSGAWASEVDVKKTQIRLRTRLLPHGRERKLLTSGDDVLVSETKELHWTNSRILWVANGSFLLNLPLVNHEHRKLAGKLVAEVGEPGKVVFLESNQFGPRIDPTGADSSVWTLFGAWPINVILLQLAAMGVIYGFARWPIFGRPRVPAADSTSDFAKHVQAVGRLLARTKDRAFATARLTALDSIGGARAAAPASAAVAKVAPDATIPTHSAGNRTAQSPLTPGNP